LLTLRGSSGPRRGPALLELGLVPDGAILIRGGIIQAVGPTRQVAALAGARNCEVIDATGRVIMPAFVDLETSLVHAHPSPRNLERLLKHYDSPDSEAFRDVLDEGARSLRALSAQTLRRRAETTAEGMVQYGTATVESRAGYDLDEAGALKVLRVQSARGPAPVDTVSTLLLSLPQGVDSPAWARWVCDLLLPKVRRRDLASFIDIEYDRNSLPAPIALMILGAAAQLGFGIKVHSGFFALSSAAALAARARTLSVGNLHAITPDEIEMLARSSTVAILKPGVTLQIGMSSATPGRALIDAGVIPGLASGYHPELSPSYNMQLILLLACRLYRLRPEEAINAATINNAFAIGAEASLGTLESGKQADLLILKISDYREIAYYAGVNIVDKVVKWGEVVYP
jgi:imidazolonepropionase